MKRKTGFPLFPLLVLATAWVMPSTLWCNENKSDESPAGEEDEYGAESGEKQVNEQAALADSTGALEEEGEEEACDCGTMAEGECAPCPDGYDD